MLKIILVLLLILLLIIGLGTHFVAPYAILQPTRQPAAKTPADEGLRYEDWSVEATAKPAIAAYYVYADRETPLAHILLLHGIGSNKEAWIDLAGVLSKRGYATLLIDHRAQGQSEGEYATFGHFEKHDISRIIDRLEEAFPDLPLGVWGHSYGGAVALQAMAHDQRIDFGLSQSTFARLEQIVADYFQRFTAGWGPRWLAKYALRRAGKIAGFRPAEVQPIEAARQINQPMFIAHGEQDENIKVKYGRAIYEALGSSEKELAIIPGADHDDVGLKGGKELFERQLQFVEESIKLRGD
ncbi:MAG: alpha/beta fold hydrolase [Bacteroidota bacterium]